MARGTRRSTDMNPRRNTHPEQLRDARKVLMPELCRVLESGVMQSFIAKHANIGKTQLTEIAAGRQTKVTVKTQGDLLEVLIQIQTGELPVPHEYRRYVPGRPAAPKVANRRGDKCVRGHDYTPENTYVTPRGSRTCRICQSASRAEYRKRNPEKTTETQRASAKRRYWAKKAAQTEAAA